MPTTYKWFLKFIVANIGLLDDLLVLGQKFAAASDNLERLDIAYEALKLILSGTLPDTGMAASSIDDIESLELQVQSQLGQQGVTAQAWDGTRLRKLFDNIAPVLQVLLPILLAAK